MMIKPRVLFVSGRARSHDAGRTPFLAKPVEGKDLLDCIEWELTKQAS